MKQIKIDKLKESKNAILEALDLNREPANTKLAKALKDSRLRKKANAPTRKQEKDSPF